MPSAIVTDATEALLQGDDFRRGNTRVEHGGLSLHGNLLVKVHSRNPNSLLISVGGNPSRATKERLQGALEAFGIPGQIRMRYGDLILADHPGNRYSVYLHVGYVYLIDAQTFTRA